MHESLQEIQAKRRSRISATGPLTSPAAHDVAVALDKHARQESWMLVSHHLNDISDAGELLAVKDALAAMGRPFDTLFPDSEPDIYATLTRILGRSDISQRHRFSQSLSLLELEALGRYEH